MSSPAETTIDPAPRAKEEPSRMARVRPFAAYRYVTSNRDVSALTAPPYDVLSSEQRSALIRGSKHNVVALELPEGSLDATRPGNRYENGARTWRAWREQRVVAQDEEPSVYVLEQLTRHEGTTTRRRAFILEVALEPFSAGVILPHERTLPKALGDRFELIRATRANFSQVLGLFDDPKDESDPLLDAVATGEPICTATDADGVTSRLWKTSSPAVASQVCALFADKRVFIADGHHRYTTALAYRDERRRDASPLNENAAEPAYDFVMMALVRMDDPGLIVMPTHRVADAPGSFDAATFWEFLGDRFDVTVPPAPDAMDALERSDRPAFLVRTRADAQPRLVTLRSGVDVDSVIVAERSSAWKHLDVAILQELILDPLLDIHPDRPQTLDRLRFIKDAAATLHEAAHHDVAFVLRPTRVDQLRAVALAGETMPQKSTYFYPKLLSGLLFRSSE